MTIKTRKNTPSCVCIAFQTASMNLKKMGKKGEKKGGKKGDKISYFGHQENYLTVCVFCIAEGWQQNA